MKNIIKNQYFKKINLYKIKKKITDESYISL
jgi:hypothetical protein